MEGTIRSRTLRWGVAVVSLLLGTWGGHALAGGGVRIEMPASGAVVLGNRLTVEVAGCKREPRAIRLLLDGRVIAPAWSKAPYSRRWMAELSLGSTGPHHLSISGAGQIEFSSRASGTLDLAESLARHAMALQAPSRLSWDWGPGILLYAMSRLASVSPPDSARELSDYVSAYHSAWLAHPAELDRSDSCPPALSALWLAERDGDRRFLAPAAAVAEYIRDEPKNSLGALNHLGHSFFSRFFPDSIWVDSLMMTSVFAAQWGAYTNDRELMDFAAAQPAIYASVLQDPATGLFRHAWKTRSRAAIPGSATFWLRGNGWVMASIVEILDALPADHPARPGLIAILRRLARGLMATQLPDGQWDSLANLPGETYPETSGTLLVSYGLARGAREGWLPPEALEAAKHAFAAVSERLETKSGGFSLPGISGSTNPGPRFLYRWVPQVHDASYGVGAYLLAATELQTEDFDR